MLRLLFSKINNRDIYPFITPVKTQKGVIGGINFAVIKLVQTHIFSSKTPKSGNFLILKVEKVA